MNVDGILNYLTDREVRKIRNFLINHKYAGLYNDDLDCFCPTDDLFPCGSVSDNCKATFEDRTDEQWEI